MKLKEKLFYGCIAYIVIYWLAVLVLGLDIGRNP